MVFLIREEFTPFDHIAFIHKSLQKLGYNLYFAILIFLNFLTFLLKFLQRFNIFK